MVLINFWLFGDGKGFPPNFSPTYLHVHIDVHVQLHVLATTCIKYYKYSYCLAGSVITGLSDLT